MDKNRFFRAIPKVDTLIEQCDSAGLFDRYGREITVDCIRERTEALREFIGKSQDETEIIRRTESLLPDIASAAEKLFSPNLKPVVNATGTVLHTNLGRALISKKHAEHLMAMVSGYSNLEYDLEAGARGERYSHFEKLLCRITGAEAAMAVNNNAAAVMLTLSALCRGGEVPVSRGELVEIGGKFRVPDVMAQSGAIMVDLGTTNKTHLSDYEEAINENTAALLKVHTSNFRVVGFTESVSVAELVELGDKHGLPVIEDIGSGVLIDLSKYGLTYEPTVQESIRAGAAIVCFSGDKLLGGPQAGIAIGKAEYIQAMKKNQFARVVRIDKLTLAALEATLLDWRDGTAVPVSAMLSAPPEELRRRAEALAEALSPLHPCTAVETQGEVGGGARPGESLPAWAAALEPAEALEAHLRAWRVPILGRIHRGKLLLDVRTLLPGDEAEIAAALAAWREGTA